ncbi:SWI/SNF complex 60 kDa subunit [Ramaria rubella]|nr:SWI/SNF complex 60 kDa subunit [Ramaria rubella]
MSTAAAAAGMEAPKTAKRRKLTDKTLPSSLANEFKDSQLYLDLLEVERKLDWTMSRKKMEIHDAYAKVSVVPRTLRVFLSHSVEGQPWQSGGEGVTLDPTSLDFASGQGIPSWTFKVEGRLLDAPNSNAYAQRLSLRKFSSFLKAVIVEFDRDPAIYPDGNIVEWRGTGSHAEQDGFEIKRRGDVSVPARVILHLKRTPERYKLVEPLVEVLDMKEETRTGIITALWHYIKVNGLQDKVDRKIIRPDAKLRAIFGVDQITFQQLPDVVNRCLKPVDPVVLSYTINVEPGNTSGMKAYDIEIAMDDAALKAKMTAVHAPGESAKQLAALDEEIAIAAQSIRSSKTKLDFLNAFAADPRAFVQTWLASQSRDLDVVLGNEQGVREEDLKNSQFFGMPWVDDAVSVQEGLRVTNALRAQQGTMG